MSIITSIWAREILDSRGNPTVKLKLVLNQVLSAELRFLPAPQQVQEKRLKCVMAINLVTKAKAFPML